MSLITAAQNVIKNTRFLHQIEYKKNNTNNNNNRNGKVATTKSVKAAKQQGKVNKISKNEIYGKDKIGYDGKE